MSSTPPPVSIVLKEKGIPHRVFVHPGPLNSIEQAAEERGQRPEQIVRTILFKVSKDNYIMVLIAGPQQIDWKMLRQHLGTSRMTMATAEEVLDVTGYKLGAVAPFGLNRSVDILVDESVLAEREVSMGSGFRNLAVILKSKDLMAALGNVEVDSFAAKRPVES